VNFTYSQILTWFAFVGFPIPQAGVFARDFGELWLGRVESLAAESGLGADGDRVQASDPAAQQKALRLHRFQNERRALFRS
jgi:hypothetical protein